MAQNHEYMQAAYFEYWERRLTQQTGDAGGGEEPDKAAEQRGSPSHCSPPSSLFLGPLAPRTALTILAVPAGAAAMISRVAALVSALQKAAADEEMLSDAGTRFNDLLEKVRLVPPRTPLSMLLVCTLGCEGPSACALS